MQSRHHFKNDRELGKVEELMKSINKDLKISDKYKRTSKRVPAKSSAPTAKKSNNSGTSGEAQPGRPDLDHKTLLDRLESGAKDLRKAAGHSKSTRKPSNNSPDESNGEGTSSPSSVPCAIEDAAEYTSSNNSAKSNISEGRSSTSGTSMGGGSSIGSSKLKTTAKLLVETVSPLSKKISRSRVRKHGEYFPDEVNTIIENDLKREMEGIPEKVGPIEFEERVKVIDALLAFHSKQELAPNTLYKAVQLFDNYLAAKHKDSETPPTPKKADEVWTLAWSNFFTAVKYWQNGTCSRGRRLRRILRDPVNQKHFKKKQDLWKCEKDVLLTLDFNLTHPTVYNFLESYLLRLEQSKVKDFARLRQMSNFYCDVCLYDIKMVGYRPSAIAAACLYVSVGDYDCHRELADILKWDFRDLDPIFQQIYNFYTFAEENEFNFCPGLMDKTYV